MLLLLRGHGADEPLFRHQTDHLRDVMNLLCLDYHDCPTELIRIGRDSGSRHSFLAGDSTMKERSCAAA